MRGVPLHLGPKRIMTDLSEEPNFIVEADGGSRGNPGPAASGTVIKRGDGVVVGELAEYLGETTNNVAEYHGMLAGLEFVAQHTRTARIEVRLDSKLVVEQMSGRWKIKNAALRTIALRARDAYDPRLVTYVWVPRAANADADALVNEMLDLVASGGDDPIRRHHFDS